MILATVFVRVSWYLTFLEVALLFYSVLAKMRGHKVGNLDEDSLSVISSFLILNSGEQNKIKQIKTKATMQQLNKLIASLSIKTKHQK